MAKELEITIAGSVFTATMLEELAPKTCEEVLNLLPLQGKVFHASWSGEMLFFKCSKIPDMLEPENQTVYPSRGDVALNVRLKEIQIVYGQAQLRARYGLAPDNVFAVIRQNLEGLNKAGNRIHREGAMNIKIKLVS